MLEKNISLDLLELIKNQEFDVKAKERILEISKPKRQTATFPKKIQLSQNLLKSLFLIFGDGHYKSKLFLTNKNYMIHNFVIATFENELKIKRDFWRLRIIHSENKKQKQMGLVKNYWLSSLQFKENQLYPTISSSTKYQTGVFGIARIQIDKITYADVIRTLIQKVEQLISENKISSKNYCIIADAILNAEGSVLRDSKGIHRLTISFNQSEKNLFKTIFSHAVTKDILYDKKDRFTISTWNFIYQFLKPFVKYNLMPFSLRPKDAFNLAAGFINHKRTKALRNYLETIQNNEGKSFSEIAKLSNRDWKSAKQTLQIRTQEFIEIRKFKNKHLTFISKEGINLLNLLYTLENWLPSITAMPEEDNFKLEKYREVINYLAN